MGDNGRPPFGFVVGMLLALTACGADPKSSSPVDQADARFEPAPMPRVRAVRPGSRSVLEIPIPPKMPLGSGAVPVSGGPVRGSVVTGLKQSF